jgi:hypothetical protein
VKHWLWRQWIRPSAHDQINNLFHHHRDHVTGAERRATRTDGVVIPVVCRPQVPAISKKLRATLSGWDNTFWNLKDWYREA